jgi:hypothetical protein
VGPHVSVAITAVMRSMPVSEKYHGIKSEDNKMNDWLIYASKKISCFIHYSQELSVFP